MIDRLLEQRVYKNYKELCEVMDWKVSAGKSKQLQLKDFKRYCTYHKEGNKFVIDEIYDIPKTKTDNRNKYGDYLEKLLIHELSKRPLNKNGRTISVSRNTLYFQLHLLNLNYNYCRNNINKFSRWTEVPITCVYDFYNNTSSKLKDNVERTLNKLQNRCLIKWEYRYAVKITTGANRLATDNEINIVLEAEREALKILKEDSKCDVFKKGKWNEYQNEIKKLLADTNIMYSYKVFHINTTKDFRQILLEESDLIEYQNEVNSTMYLSAIDTAKRKYNKTKEECIVKGIKGTYFRRPKFESQQAQLRPEYISDTQKIVDKVIEFDAIKIDLSNISDSKYTLIEALCDESGQDWGVFLDDALEELL